jgi:hypothetical protein
MRDTPHKVKHLMGNIAINKNHRKCNVCLKGGGKLVLKMYVACMYGNTTMKLL